MASSLSPPQSEEGEAPKMLQSLGGKETTGRHSLNCARQTENDASDPPSLLSVSLSDSIIKSNVGCVESRTWGTRVYANPT